MRASGVTISDLARELGVAKSTVSRALNGYPDISDALRERVQAAADARGYRASSTARNLKRGRLDTVGLVLPIDGAVFADPFLSVFLDGVSRELERSELDLLVATASPIGDGLDVYRRLLASRKVDGFILPRTKTEDRRIDLLREQGAPFVTSGRTARPNAYAWIDIDNRAAFEEAAARLARMGHRRIACVGGGPGFNYARLRLEGYRRGLAAAGLPRDPALECAGGVDMAAGVAAAEALMQLPEPPTALLCQLDTVAIGAMRALTDLGLTVGDEVSVIGYGDSPLSAYVDPGLTTFSQMIGDVGRRAAELLVALLAGAPPRTLQELRRAELVIRGSDGPPSASSKQLRQTLDRRRRRGAA